MDRTGHLSGGQRRRFGGDANASRWGFDSIEVTPLIPGQFFVIKNLLPLRPLMTTINEHVPEENASSARCSRIMRDECLEHVNPSLRRLQKKARITFGTLSSSNLSPSPLPFSFTDNDRLISFL